MVKFAAKLMLIGAVVSLLLYAYSSITFGAALVTALVFAVVAWLVGDQLVLRTTSNATSAAVDGLMCLAYLWIVGSILSLDLNFGEMLLISAIVGVVEYFFHRYALKPDRVTGV